MFNFKLFHYFFQTIAFQNQAGIHILNLNVMAVYCSGSPPDKQNTPQNNKVFIAPFWHF